MHSLLILPLLMPLMAVALIMLQTRGERPLRPRRLWIAPLLLGGLVAAAIAVVPRPAFDLAAWEALVFATASGMAFGGWRAHATALRHDPDTGRIMASQSTIAGAVLAGAFLLRTVVRDALGVQAALITDMSMLFALGMIVALNAALWRRARDLMPADRRSLPYRNRATTSR